MRYFKIFTPNSVFVATRIPSELGTVVIKIEEISKREFEKFRPQLKLGLN